MARTRRGKVAKMRRETLHSTMKATMKDVRSDVMFCKITEILSAMADFTSVASVARRAATRLELFSSLSNHPTSLLRIAARIINFRFQHQEAFKGKETISKLSSTIKRKTINSVWKLRPLWNDFHLQASSSSLELLDSHP